MMRRLIFLILLLPLVSCQPEPPPDAVTLPGRTSIPQDAPSEISDQVAFDAVDGIDLRLRKPSNWESFSTEYGLVIAERLGTVATEGVLEGLLAYVFFTPLTEFDIPTSNSDNIFNLTQEVLAQIVTDPEYVGGATVDGVYGFEWDGQPAAYYSYNLGSGTVTLVIGVTLNSNNSLMQVSVSAPYEQRSRIRETLPTLLDGLEVNDFTFDGDDLNTLPDPLTYPDYP